MNHELYPVHNRWFIYDPHCLYLPHCYPFHPRHFSSWHVHLEQLPQLHRRIIISEIGPI